MYKEQISHIFAFSTAGNMHTGKSDPYCEVSLGSEIKRTRVIQATLNPKWNDSMQFSVKDLHEDILCITVYDKDYFAPNRKLASWFNSSYLHI